MKKKPIIPPRLITYDNLESYEAIEKSGIKPNFIKVKSYNPFKYHFLFLDSKEYLCTSIFARYKLNIKIHDTGEHEEMNISIVHCSIYKKDFDKFIDCMNELWNKALIHNVPRYRDICCTIIFHILRASMSEEEVEALVEECKREGD